MKSKSFLAAILLLAASATLSAQTNVQLHYDFGRAFYHNAAGKKADLSKNGAARQVLTTTVEHWNGDRFGSNFFFIDLDYGGSNAAGKNGIRGA